MNDSSSGKKYVDLFKELWEAPPKSEPMTPGGRTRLTLDLSPETVRKLDAIKKATEHGSSADVLRQALRLYEQMLTTVKEGGSVVEVRKVDFGSDILKGFSSTYGPRSSLDKPLTRVFLSSALDQQEEMLVLAKELAQANRSIEPPSPAEVVEEITRAVEDEKKPELSVSALIIPERKVHEGLLLKSTSLVWGSVVQQLQDNWEKAYEMPPELWEEIIAGAYWKDGFNEVILTPRSGDLGRDVIAIKHGVGSVKILGSVKRYDPGRLITRAQVHELLGVVTGDLSASKGVLTTTSDFAPKLLDDPGLAKAVPHRLELMNGRKLQDWLKELLLNPKK